MLLFPSLLFVFWLLCHSSSPALFRYISGATYLHPSPVNLTEPFVSHGGKGNICTADTHHLSTSYLEIPRQSNCWAGEQHCATVVETWDPGVQKGPHILSWFPGSSSVSVQSRFVSKIPGRTLLSQSQPEPTGWASLFLLMTCNDIHHLLHELHFQNICHGEVRHIHWVWFFPALQLAPQALGPHFQSSAENDQAYNRNSVVTHHVKCGCCPALV